MKLFSGLLLLCFSFQLYADPSEYKHSHVGGAISHPPFSSISLTWYKDIVYDPDTPDTHRTSLDIYTPGSDVENAPVLFFIHGGGLRVGDKAWSKDLDPKPEFFTNKHGYIFVSTNYRLLPDGQYPVNAQDIAKSLAWVKENISSFGGNPDQIILMAHSAGAGLASLISTDEQFLQAVGANLELVKGMILVDGSTYFLDTDQVDTKHMLERYGKSWKLAAPATHIEKGKGIPPALLLYVAGDSNYGDVEVQSVTFARALNKAGVSARTVGLDHVNHFGANERIGDPGDITTAEIERFLAKIVQ